MIYVGMRLTMAYYNMMMIGVLGTFLFDTFIICSKDRHSNCKQSVYPFSHMHILAVHGGGDILSWQEYVYSNAAFFKFPSYYIISVVSFPDSTCWPSFSSPRATRPGP